jgi:hypothetical protein
MKKQNISLDYLVEANGGRTWTFEDDQIQSYKIPPEL